MLNADPSGCVAYSMLIVVGWFWGNSTRCDRQSAALLHAHYIHLKVILYVANSSPHLFTLLLAFFHLEILLVACGHFLLLLQLVEGK